MSVTQLFLVRKNLLRIAASMAIGFPLPSFTAESYLPPVTNAVTATAPPLENVQGSKLFKAYRPGDSFSGSDIFKPATSFPLSPPPNLPAPSKRNDELIDREKNWMFVSRDEKEPDATEDAFGIDEATLEANKGVLTRFLENKPGPEAQAAAEEKKEADQALSDRQLFGLNPRTQKGGGQAPVVNSLQPQYLEKNFNGTDSEKARFSDLWREQYGPNANRLRVEKQTQMKEFENLFSSQNGAVAGGGSLNSLNAPNDLGVQPLQPSRDNLTQFNPGAILASPDRFMTSRSVSGANALSLPAINSPLTPTATPSLQPAPSKPVAQPVVLPFPKRRF